MRLFVSIDFPAEIFEELYSRTPDIKGWRKTPPGQIHLTLFFIGDCTRAEFEHISALLADITFEPFELIIENFGVFPGRKEPAILWCGVKDSHGLMGLQKKVETKLAAFRKKPDHKPFFPHITLARRKSDTGRSSQLNDLLSMDQHELRYMVDRFSLKESILKPGGSEHHLLTLFTSEMTG